MSRNSRPLWKLLLELSQSPTTSSLTCADCFSILEYLAELDPGNMHWSALILKARQHLSACPDCQEYYQKRLDELEALGEKEL